MENSINCSTARAANWTTKSLPGAGNDDHHRSATTNEQDMNIQAPTNAPSGSARGCAIDRFGLTNLARP